MGEMGGNRGSPRVMPYTSLPAKAVRRPTSMTPLLTSQWLRFVWRPPTRSRLSTCVRAFATHRDPYPASTSSLLSEQLDKASARASNRSGPSGVGPFSLGIQHQQLKPGERIKEWSELNAGEKVIRTTAKTSNLAVILLGAGLSAVLVYALATELFSSNSPTILFGQASDKLQTSPQLANLLHGPLKFHTTPPLPAGVRPRHRSRHVASQIAVDSTGREHMLMNFWIEGASETQSKSDDDTQEEDWSLDRTVQWTKTTSTDLWESGKRSFALLTGAPLSSSPEPLEPPTPVAPAPSSGWSFLGLFSSIRGRRASSSEGVIRSIWTSGEAHADFVRDDSGLFVLRSLRVDIPSSGARNPIRVYV